MKMMAKMGGKLGQGMGKKNQGILNPLAPVAAVDKSGVGASTVKKVTLTAQNSIDMDLFKTEETKDIKKKEAEEKLKVKEEGAKEDKDFTDFFKLINQRKKQDLKDNKELTAR
jgi:hypothetical protein